MFTDEIQNNKLSVQQLLIADVFELQTCKA
jgi:hypothetical protein